MKEYIHIISQKESPIIINCSNLKKKSIKRPPPIITDKRKLNLKYPT